MLFSLHAKKKTVASTKQIYYTFCSYKYILQLFWYCVFYNTLPSTFSNAFFKLEWISLDANKNFPLHFFLVCFVGETD